MTPREQLRSASIRTLSPSEEPYQLDSSIYQRFDQRNNLTIGRPNWDKSIQSFTKRVKDTRVKRIRNILPGFQLQDYSLFFSAGAVATRIGTSINQSNRGLLKWTSLGEAAEEDMLFTEIPDELKTWGGTPTAAASMVKRVARFFGADLIRVAPLDTRWIYSYAYWNDGTHKEITFEDISSPNETESKLVIPKKMKWVLVMGVGMDQQSIKFTPSPTGCAETQSVYSKMAMLVCRLAEFLRGIGYSAIPSLNDLGLNIPIAIDAGLGEQGRNGKLITPEFGPSVRLCKVITDLPMERDYPIRFGVNQFCSVCQKCAKSCPAHAIPVGEPTWSSSAISKNAGVYTWHLNDESCRKYWALGPGTNCTICIRTCPFSKNPGISHDLVRWSIANIPQLNLLWRKIDDWLSYGRYANPRTFWDSRN